jgi:hypothetical protein
MLTFRQKLTLGSGFLIRQIKINSDSKSQNTKKQIPVFRQNFQFYPVCGSPIEFSGWNQYKIVFNFSAAIIFFSGFIFNIFSVFQRQEFQCLK